MGEWTTAGPAEALAEGEMLQVDVRGDPVVIARHGGSLYAFDGYCTHEECPLWEGDLVEHRVECYCHGSWFDIRTGEALNGPALESLATYPVREQDGELQVEA
jgi:nitrite reductase/ring-hydroxylating ferredoxin subunit